MMSVNQSVGNVTGNGNIIVQAIDSTIVIEGRPSLTLNPPISLASFNRTDLNLLNASECSIPLVGRETDFHNLHEWALHPQRPGVAHNITIRALIGRAGTGKTRLAIELMEHLRQGNAWQAGFASHKELTRFQSLSNLSFWSWVRPTLILVDYAATSAAVLGSWFAELVHNRACQLPLRILLLERHASLEGGWYTQLRDDSFTHGAAVEALFDPLVPSQLTPLNSVENRRAIVGATLKAIPPSGSALPLELPQRGADREFDRHLESGEWTEPLYLMMAALTAVDRGFATAFSFSRVDLALHLARRELSRIKQFAPQPTVDVQVTFLKHLAACATLAGTLSESQAFILIEQEAEAFHLRLPNGAAEFWDVLRRALPGKDDSVAGIQPDIIGEAVILIALGMGKATSQTAAITRLTQTLGSAIIAPIIRVAEDFATWDGGNRVTELVGWVQVLGTSDDLWFLLDLESSLPSDSWVLNEVLLKISTRLIEKLSDSIKRKLPLTTPRSRRHLIFTIAEELGNLKDDKELITEIFKGVELSRIAQNLLARLNNFGQFEEAISLATHQLKYLQNMAGNLPRLFRPRLALLHQDFAKTLQELGFYNEALLAIEPALPFYRTMIAERDESYSSLLANGLAYQGFILQKIKRPAEALAASEEAIRILDQLKLDPSKDVRPDMARALVHHSNGLSLAGKPLEALAASTIASDLFKGLASTNVAAYAGEMAHALLNHGLKLIDLNRYDEAVISVEQALKLYQEMVTVRPEVTVSHLARAYRAMATIENTRENASESSRLLKLGIEALIPWLKKVPARFGPLSALLAQDYVNIARSSGREIDMGLLEPILNFANANKAPTSQEI